MAFFVQFRFKKYELTILTDKRLNRAAPELKKSSAFELDWDIDAVIQQLRTIRNASLAARQRVERPAKLPSRHSVIEIVEGLAAALFPNRLGTREFSHQSIDYFVGHTLDEMLSGLMKQVVRELEYISQHEDSSRDHQEKAISIVRHFAADLPKIRALLETDLRAAYDGDPAARSADEVLACYPGVIAVTHHRLAHSLYVLGAPLIARMISEIAHSATGIDIHPGAEIDESFFIDHGTGVVIGESAIIAKRVRLYQAVTLGAKSFPTDENGAIVKGNARHPIVEDDVVIYAGATILGRITIGRGSVIGGNVWLTRSVPANSHITQAKVRNEVFDDGSGI